MDIVFWCNWWFQDLSQCKKVMEERGELFLQKISMSRAKVAKLCHTFIKDGAVSFPMQQNTCNITEGR